MPQRPASAPQNRKSNLITGPSRLTPPVAVSTRLSDFIVASVAARQLASIELAQRAATARVLTVSVT
jgi:hypothetical protein